MKWNLLPLDTLPDPFDIVWCKFPYYERKGEPSPDARPVVVIASGVYRSKQGVEYGQLHVAYGTGEPGMGYDPRDLAIDSMKEALSLGLHKPTRFCFGTSSRLPWCEEFFVSLVYVKSTGLIIGRLTDDLIAQARQCIKSL